MKESKFLSRERIFEFLVAAFAFSIPFKAIYNSLLVVVLALYAIFALDKRLDRNTVLGVLGVSIVFWIAVLWLVQSKNFEEGLFRVQQKSIITIIPAIFALCSYNHSRVRSVFLSFFLFGVVAAMAVSLIHGFFFWWSSGSFEKLTGHGLVEYLDVYTYILALLCLLAQVIIMESFLKGNKLLFVPNRLRMGLLLFLVMSLFILAVQQVIICWIALCLAYIFRSVKRRRWVIFSMLALPLALAAGVSFVRPLREKVHDSVFGSPRNTIPLDDSAPWKEEWNGVAIRKAIWTCSWDVVKDNPLFGVGTGNEQDELQKVYLNRKFYLAAHYNKFNAHNQYIQIIVGTGVIGFVLIFGASAWSFWRLRSSRLFLYALTAVLIAMLTESMLETNKGCLIFSIVVSLPFIGGRGEVKLGGGHHAV